MLTQSQRGVGRKDPRLTGLAPTVRPIQLHRSAIGLDRLGHAPFFLDQRRLTTRTVLIHGVGFGLHGLLHDVALEFQRALPDVLLDEAQPLLGMLLEAR